jgi:peptide/nickel transport system permease protein
MKGTYVVKLDNIILITVCMIFSITLFTGLPGNPTAINLKNALKAPDSKHLFGTDHLGRDVLSRIAHGFFRDMGLSLIIVCISVVTGTIFGLIAGYFGGWIDKLFIIIMDFILSLPNIVFALVIMLYLSYNPSSIVIALALPGWVKYARIVRSQTYSIKEADFILYEKIIGAPAFFILIKHILPNVYSSVLSLAVLHLGHSLLAIAGLGFLGLGLQPPSPEWGTMIMESRQYIMIAPWTVVFPGIFIFLLILFFTVIGYGMKEKLTGKQEVVQC